MFADALMGLSKPSQGSRSDSFYIILKHIPINLQCYGFISTMNIYFQLSLMNWEF